MLNSGYYKIHQGREMKYTHDELTENESLNFVLGEIRKEAVEQYKSNLIKWLKSQQREWQNDECSCDWGFQHTIEHIEGEK